MNRRERSMPDDSYPRSTRTPSFSSTLLDAIYRSTRQSKSNLDETHMSKQSNLRHKHGVSVGKKDAKERNMNDLRPAVTVQDWKEKQSCHSSSECGSGGFFSSSETETSYKLRSTPKSQRTHKHMNSEKQKQKPQQKVKQPVSPGSRIASFLSSIFNSGNVKKARMCYVGAVKDVSFEQKSVSSSANSSVSRRSCMRKTPSSAKGKKCSNNGVKRSVRFYPVSVILGEDDPNLMPLPGVPKITRSSSNQNRGEAAARGEFDFGVFYNNNTKNGEDEREDEDEDEEDDALSYSSSDLFELDHLIGDWRYQEELPVYETTHLDTNKAIAHGLRL